MRNITALVLSLIFTAGLSGQDLWSKVEESKITNKSFAEREIIPDTYTAFRFDESLFEKKVFALSKSKGENQESGVIIELPLPDGSLERFFIKNSDCMSPVLASKFPEIKTFSAVSADGSNHHGKLDLGTMGFHAVIKTEKGTIYVDPYFSQPDQHYISYYIKDHVVDIDSYSGTCGTEDYLRMIQEEERLHDSHENNVIHKSSQGEEVIKRTYRLAVTTSGEWGSIYGTVENVMSRIVTGVNRLNMIFENEIAASFQLIDDNDQLIFLDPQTDPFENANQGAAILGQNSIVINNIVGSGAYDIGHVFTVRCIDGVAGIAALGSVCLNNKGNGVSCVGGSNISAFMVNTTAHEIGHQFNGGHSWSNCPPAMGQLSPGTAWEPGSGSTILSYAGACGSQNILGTNDDYFHVGNLEQFINYIQNTARCAQTEPSGNHAPDISVPLGDGLVIPIATPFELEGEATDEDGDIMTYAWEQMNLGPTSPVGEPSGNAPSFRSFPPSNSPKRLFPRLPAIIGGIGSNVEVLPLYSRNLSFRFTVRDNHPGAGITVWEDISFNAVEEAGPFRVTAPNSLTFVEVGEELMLEWDVANTDAAPVNCQFVDIYFSADNGDNFDLLLKSATPNDGSEIIEIPNRITNEGKIKIKASNNIFFQLNRSNIVVREPAEAGFFIDLGVNEADICLPEQLQVEVQGTAFQAFDTPVNLDLENAPEGMEFSFTNNPMQADGTTTLVIDFDGIDRTQVLDLVVVGTAENADTIRQTLRLNITGTQFDDLSLVGPDSGLANIRQIPTFRWSSAFNAEHYTLEIATNPAFGNSSIIREEFISDTVFIPQVVLDDSQLYYWRVLAHNKCNTEATEIRTFGSVTLDCKEFVAENLPRNISFSGSVTVEGIVKVFDTGILADVNILNIKGQHSDVFQLTGKLVSPSGTEVTVFDRDCFSSTDLNIGFDNDSPRDFACPLNSGLTIKPNGGDLGVLTGEPIEGDWIFELIDNEGGDGGQFTNFELELCASFPTEDPFVIVNDTLKVPLGLSRKLTSEVLRVTDNNNGDADLVYTIVSLPTNGRLLLNGTALDLGGQFSQTDLNDALLRYVHDGDENEVDQFVFTVIDGEGGWLDMTEFDILINEDIMSSTGDIVNSTAFEVYPNPSNGFVNIASRSEADRIEVNVYSLSGQRVYRDILQGRGQIDLGYLESGLYLIRVSNGNTLGSYKLNLVK